MSENYGDTRFDLFCSNVYKGLTICFSWRDLFKVSTLKKHAGRNTCKKTSCPNNKASSKLFQLVDERNKGLVLYNVFFLKRWAICTLFFFIFVFSIIQLVEKMLGIILLMTGFELQISGVGSDRFTNWATTTALIHLMLQPHTIEDIF